MTFYLSQPTGSISLHRLTHFAHTRFAFLFKVFESGANRVDLFDVVKDIDAVEDSECLIEGTNKDRISHAILRLACCGDQDMSQFFITAETLLFDFRFSCMTKDELYQTFKSVDRYRRRKGLSDTDVTASSLKILTSIYEQCSSWRKVVQRYLNGDGYFLLPFQTVPQFVRKREVVLDHGVAYVPFYRLREVSTDVFWQLVSQGVMTARLKFSSDDERILNLIKSLKTLFHRKFRGGFLGSRQPCSILHSQVDDLVSRFPPCMAYMHRQLRRKHRLAHHARIQYTLFLKEVGLPVHEAILFWKEEYSKIVHPGASCQHHWSANEKRYIYSIRHLYGLEGSRINYRGHSCTAIQESYHGPQDESGCPFSHFDEDHLSQMLEEEELPHRKQEIMSLASRRLLSQACHNFLMAKIEKEKNCHVQNKLFIHSNQSLRTINSPKLENKSTDTYSCSVYSERMDMKDLSLDNKSDPTCLHTDKCTGLDHGPKRRKYANEGGSERNGISGVECKKVLSAYRHLEPSCTQSLVCGIQEVKINDIKNTCAGLCVKQEKKEVTSVSKMVETREEGTGRNDISRVECKKVVSAYRHLQPSCTQPSICDVQEVKINDIKNTCACFCVVPDKKEVTSVSTMMETSAVCSCEDSPPLTIENHPDPADRTSPSGPYSTDNAAINISEDKVSNSKVDNQIVSKKRKVDTMLSLNCSNTSINGLGSSGESITFSKPVNYYLSYTKLLNHLKQL